MSKYPISACVFHGISKLLKHKCCRSELFNRVGALFWGKIAEVNNSHCGFKKRPCCMLIIISCTYYLCDVIWSTLTKYILFFFRCFIYAFTTEGFPDNTILKSAHGKVERSFWRLYTIKLCESQNSVQNHNRNILSSTD